LEKEDYRVTIGRVSDAVINVEASGTHFTSGMGGCGVSMPQRMRLAVVWSVVSS
jgi:hypothetical protein